MGCSMQSNEQKFFFSLSIMLMHEVYAERVEQEFMKHVVRPKIVHSLHPHMGLIDLCFKDLLHS